jgi:transglutaminase-like putative cysteine protease
LHRPNTRALGAWAAMFLLAASIGYAGHIGLSAAQAWLTNVATEWLVGSGSRTDPYRSSTDIGAIGKLKLSDTVVLRLATDGNGAESVRLHRASYDYYASGVWLARNSRFGALAGERGGSTWTLQPDPPIRHFRVYDDSPRGNPVLSLPSGTVNVSGLDATSLRRNPLGAVQAERAPGFFSYQIGVNPRAQDEGEPVPDDLKLSSSEQAMLRELAARIGLMGLEPDAVGRRLSEWFASGFAYTIYQQKAGEDLTPLATFLLKTHAGHCEHFATATVLLARAAGVPARYATGLVAQEYSARQGAYIVRERHAHAWARLHAGGRWQDVDTTPAAWFAIETARAPAWEPLYDALSWLHFEFLKWLASARDANLKLAAFAGFAAVFAWIGWRILARRSRVPARRAEAQMAVQPRPGADSEYYQVEARLGTLGFPRGRSEPVGTWTRQFTNRTELDPQAIERISTLHTRLRFDPEGLDESDRRALRQQALDWLERHRLSGRT